MSFSDICGWLGSLAILIAYWLVSADRIEARSFTNQLMNLCGTFGVGYNSYTNSVWAVVALDIVWALVALNTIRGLLKASGEPFRDYRKN